MKEYERRTDALRHLRQHDDDRAFLRAVTWGMIAVGFLLAWVMV